MWRMKICHEKGCTAVYDCVKSMANRERGKYLYVYYFFRGLMGGERYEAANGIGSLAFATFWRLLARSGAVRWLWKVRFLISVKVFDFGHKTPATLTCLIYNYVMTLNVTKGWWISEVIPKHIQLDSIEFSFHNSIEWTYIDLRHFFFNQFTSDFTQFV